MMTNLVDVFSLVLNRLESENIQYMIVGSIASMTYGEPRLTHDMDLVVNLAPEDMRKIVHLFSDEDEFYCPPPEVIRVEIREQGRFNLIHSDSGLKVDLIMRKNTPFEIQAFERRRLVKLWKDSQVWMSSPEDVILNKLIYFNLGGSEKHLRDIRGIVALLNVDYDYIKTWVQTLNLGEAWKKI